MTTDIHGPYVEVNLRPGEDWQCVGDLAWHQDYEAFALMAGVRADTLEIDPLFAPRGVPPDKSLRYDMHHRLEGGDCHSHSWLTYEELGRVQEAYPVAPSFQINLARKFMAAVAEEGYELLQRAHEYWAVQHEIRANGSLEGGYPPRGFESPEEIVVRAPEVRLVFCFDN